MKKFLPGIIILFFSLSLSAKKVKFAVDMTGQAISPLGVHIVGDFQEAAGFSLNWDPSVTSLTQEGATDIYSIIVNIPAFQKYEYRFINGDQTYESEFVPDESRVGYNFNDNRWMYLDSLKNDTTFVGAILFGGNAPTGLNLVRFKVDMNNAMPVASEGIHFMDNMGTANPTGMKLYTFGGGIYEIIHYYASNSYSYKFYNGAVAETIPVTCSVFGNRDLTIAQDTVMEAVCFSSCSSCIAASIKEINNSVSSFKLFPNPAKNKLTIASFLNDDIESISIYNLSGEQVKLITDLKQDIYTITDLSLAEGMYIVRVTNSSQQQQNLKLIIE